jgi:sulfatase maturation enzyme AslB (radical SAM superfamily)
MTGGHLSLILLATGRCNAACDYCFEDPGSGRLSIERLGRIIDQVLAHMDARQIPSLTIHWQGGEAMLLPPSWYRQAFDTIAVAADARGKEVAHGLQTNLLAYHAGWNPIIAEMFGNCLSTSIDVPNRHRRIAGRPPAEYDRILTQNLDAARAAGIAVTAISVPNRGTLELGAEGFYAHMVEGLGVTDFQLNTPFPGGSPNAVKRELALNLDALIRFHCDLADIWLARGAAHGVRIGPFDELLNVFQHRDASRRHQRRSALDNSLVEEAGRQWR